MNPRMNSKLNSIDNQVKKGGRGTSGGGGGSSAVLENLAQESYGIANNIVESKWFKYTIEFIIYFNLITVLIQTSILTEFRQASDERIPANLNTMLLHKYPSSEV